MGGANREGARRGAPIDAGVANGGRVWGSDAVASSLELAAGQGFERRHFFVLEFFTDLSGPFV